MEQYRERLLNVIIWLASWKIKEGGIDGKIGLKKAREWILKLQKIELWSKFGRVILAIQAWEIEWDSSCIYRRSKWDQKEE